MFIRSILVQYFKLSPEHRKLLRVFAYSITENDAKQDDSAAEIDAKVQAYREQLEREAAEKESGVSPDAESIAWGNLPERKMADAERGRLWKIRRTDSLR